ncbi:hypothetical protein Tco_1441749, partial [Tanacetum coccineum]
GSVYGSATVKDDSPVKEVAVPVKVKKVSRRLQKTVPTENKESSTPWTIEEDVTLCQAWCDVSENSITGNAMKSRGFWLKVRPRIGAFCNIFDNVRQRNESGPCDLTVYQKACVEYAAEYDRDFSLEPCWKILKNHLAWKKVEMPSFYSKQTRVAKKQRLLKSPQAQRKVGLRRKHLPPLVLKSHLAAGGGIVDMVAEK